MSDITFPVAESVVYTTLQLDCLECGTLLVNARGMLTALCPHCGHLNPSVKLNVSAGTAPAVAVKTDRRRSNG